jgi:hypothetical protein
MRENIGLALSGSSICLKGPIPDFIARRSVIMRTAVPERQGRDRKTLVAVNLASVAGRCVYLDCDVEAPNGNFFLIPGISVRKTCPS